MKEPKPEFNSGINKDGLKEEVVTEFGEEDYPLRRAVGMDAFKSDAEKNEYMAQRELIPEREEFKGKVFKVISSVFIEHHGKPSLSEAMKKSVSEKMQLPAESINVSVTDDLLGYRVEIDHPKYGKLDFDFTR